MLVITEPEATNCFSINFQVFTSGGQETLKKFILNMLLYKKTANAKSYSHWPVTITSEAVNLDQSECRKINSYLEIYIRTR